jgi:flavin reductase (DIM6/NTAB) family NADH-FMN oxidoreductase RutF
MIQSIVPRPIAWVLSDNGDGTLNLAPFSYFNAVCSDPPLLMLSIGRKADGSDKDTARNIVQRKHFVVHIPHRTLAVEVSESSRPLPFGESELSRQGLTAVPFAGSVLPRLAEARVAFACELHSTQELGPQLLVFGRLRQAWLDDAVATADEKGRVHVDAQALDPLGRLGGDDYSVGGACITVPRSWR